MTTFLNACEIFPSQIPDKENGFHAVCTARIVSPSGQTFTAIGEAASEGNASELTPLQRAGQCAYDRAVELMQRHGGSKSCESPAQQVPWQPTPAKSRRAVGGPITDKQKRFLETTAIFNGKTLDDAEAIALEMYGRSIDGLTTKEVNPVLDRLRA